MRRIAGMFAIAAIAMTATIATPMIASAAEPPPMASCERVPTNMHNIEAVYVGAACPPWLFVAYRHHGGSSGPTVVREHKCEPKETS